MSADVETMMYVREVPWHGLGIQVENPQTSKEAIVAAGLDWRVDSKPIFNEFGNEIAGFYANTRDKDGKVLGVVGNKYKIVQNSDAFDFTDSLLDDGMVYETAGSLNGGKKIWLLGKMPETKILNDKVEPYVCFVNSHDGTGAIKVCMTPVRVVCNNTLNFALNTAKRMWSTIHVGNMESKLNEAKATLGLIDNYMKALDVDCEKMANYKMSDAEFEGIFDELYPVDSNEDSQRRIENINNIKTTLFNCLAALDIQQYKDTAYGKMMAVTDFADHSKPNRMTAKYYENRWGKIITGHPFVDAMYTQIRQAVG